MSVNRGNLAPLRIPEGIEAEDFLHQLAGLWGIWGFPEIMGIYGYHFVGPNGKDYSILWSILGSPIKGNYHLIRP